MADTEKNETIHSLQKNHIDITDKKETIDIQKILNKDCELILFELPKNFDKKKLKEIKFNKVIENNKPSLNTRFLNYYKCICYAENHPIVKQTLTLLNSKKQKKVIFKPINKYVKVYEALSLLEPKEESIIKRKLRVKK